MTSVWPVYFGVSFFWPRVSSANTRVPVFFVSIRDRAGVGFKRRDAARYEEPQPFAGIATTLPAAGPELAMAHAQHQAAPSPRSHVASCLTPSMAPGPLASGSTKAPKHASLDHVSLDHIPLGPQLLYWPSGPPMPSPLESHALWATRPGNREAVTCFLQPLHLAIAICIGQARYASQSIILNISCHLPRKSLYSFQYQTCATIITLLAHHQRRLALCMSYTLLITSAAWPCACCTHCTSPAPPGLVHVVHIAQGLIHLLGLHLHAKSL